MSTFGSMEQLRAALAALATPVEDVWIQREVLRGVLRDRFKVSEEEMAAIENAALGDGRYRSLARQAYERYWQAVEQAGVAAAVEDISATPPQSGEPN